MSELAIAPEGAVQFELNECNAGYAGEPFVWVDPIPETPEHFMRLKQCACKVFYRVRSSPSKAIARSKQIHGSQGTNVVFWVCDHDGRIIE